MCSGIGTWFSHSKDVAGVSLEIHEREDAEASHIVHKKTMIATNEIRLPSEEMMFHVVKESG